jgi:hypothetical protein
LVENAIKLAMIRAISRDPVAPVIDGPDMAWGRVVATHCMDTLLQEASRHIADSDYDAKINRALDYIRRHGPISAMEMFRKGWRLPEREREEILRSLVNMRMVTASTITGKNGGRPALRYMLVEAAGYETSKSSPESEP